MTTNLPTGVRLQSTRRLSTAEVAALVDLVDDATDVDGVRPLSEHVLLHLRYGGDEPTRNLLVWRQEPRQLLAYAHLDITDPVEGPSAEMVVAPSARRQGFGRALIEGVLEQSGDRLRLWAHGDLPEASLMAEELGFQRARVLWQMRRSLFAPLPRVDLPDGIAIRTFVPGADDAAWLALNARAFADHPEQGAWTQDDLQRRMSEAWFDPAGFFLAERTETGELVGFHWTKVHGSQAGHMSDQGDHHHRHGADHSHDQSHDHSHDHGHEPIGEVYVVGVDPDAHARGLGRLLTVIGLRHLRSMGLLEVMLYVDESNTPAIKLYQSLGFTQFAKDVLFRRG